MDNHKLVNNLQHWKKENRFEERLRQKSYLFVSEHNDEVHYVPLSQRSLLYGSVPPSWNDPATGVEQSLNLCVTSRYYFRIITSMRS